MSLIFSEGSGSGPEIFLLLVDGGVITFSSVFAVATLAPFTVVFTDGRITLYVPFVVVQMMQK